jgi:hypothetical protein
MMKVAIKRGRNWNKTSTSEDSVARRVKLII